MAGQKNIVVVPYNPLWPEIYRREADRIAGIFGAELISIHHVGSTAIPGIRAKPIIDLMPLVHDIDRVDAFNEAMITLGYEPKGENHIPGRRFFSKGGDTHRSHNIHTYQPDNPEVARHLDFRDYLIAHPEARQRYELIKIEAAGHFPDDIDGYSGAKESFIVTTTQKAHRWRSELSAQTIEVGEASLQSVDRFIDLLEEVGSWLWLRGVKQWPPGSHREKRSTIIRLVERGCLILAHRRGELVGGCILSDMGSAAWPNTAKAFYLCLLVVARSAAGQGVGRRIIEGCTPAMARRGKQLLRLDCWEGNTFLKSYYQNEGFTMLQAVREKDYLVRLFEKEISNISV